MAIFSIIFVILAIIIPIGIIALIVHLIGKKNSNNGEKKDNFEISFSLSQIPEYNVIFAL